MSFDLWRMVVLNVSCDFECCLEFCLTQAETLSSLFRRESFEFGNKGKRREQGFLSKERCSFTEPYVVTTWMTGSTVENVTIETSRDRANETSRDTIRSQRESCPIEIKHIGHADM